MKNHIHVCLIYIVIVIVILMNFQNVITIIVFSSNRNRLPWFCNRPNSGDNRRYLHYLQILFHRICNHRHNNSTSYNLYMTPVINSSNTESLQIWSMYGDAQQNTTLYNHYSNNNNNIYNNNNVLLLS